MSKILQISRYALATTALAGATIFGTNRAVRSLKNDTEAALNRVTQDVLTKGGTAIIDESVKRSIPPIADEIALNLFVPGFDKESMGLRAGIRNAREQRLASKFETLMGKTGN